MLLYSWVGKTIYKTVLIEQCESESNSDFYEPFFQTQIQEDDLINTKVSLQF